MNQWITNLYCGTAPADASSELGHIYRGCKNAAEQVPMKAGTFAAGALVLGLGLGWLLRGWRGA
jgi:hypothetical protein